MNKTLKTILIIAAVLIVVAAIVVGLVLYLHNAKYISASEATEIAIANAGLNRNEILKTDADFEKNSYSAWYEVELESRTTEYDYDIDAVTGEILASRTEPRD